MAHRITSMIHSLFSTPASAARARPTAHAAGAGADSAATAAAELQPWLLAARTVTAQAVPVRARRQGQWVDLPADESAQEALRRWRIHTGVNAGNPAAVDGDEAGRRSTVRRVLEDGVPCWSKVFNATQGSQKAEQNERLLMIQLAGVASTPELSPRDHVAHLVKAQREAGGNGGRATATRIAQYLTTDAGPNLDTWQLWAPCVLLPPHDMVVPLFAHPTFLAALVWRGLVALEAVSLFGFVHNDIKPENIALQLPADARASDGCLRFTWNLRDLPLRLLDFELGHMESSRIPLLPESNFWASPYALACHRRALLLHDRISCEAQLAGIDWGADLWSLGHSLRVWCEDAERMLALCRADVRREVPDAALRDAAIQLLADLLPGLNWLRGMAARLQTHDRDPAVAADQSLRPRDDRLMPHALLRAELEQAFAHLSPTARPPEWPVVMAMPDPAQPVWPPASAQPAAVPRAPPPLRDLAELSVPGEGDDLPTFIVIPHLGRVTLGEDDEAITADIRHRFAMGKTLITLGQWKRFWNAADRDYTPAWTSDAESTWDKYQDEPDYYPVRNVNVADAEAYARWFHLRFAGRLGATVQEISLPSELEWELAACGGQLTASNQAADPMFDVDFLPEGGAPRPFGGKWGHCNRYGLWVATGRMWEWTCSPWRSSRTELPSDGRDSAGPLKSRSARSVFYFGRTPGEQLMDEMYGRLDHNDLALDYPRFRLLSSEDDYFMPDFRFDGVGFRLVVRIAP